ncbi:MAG: molybdenum cofactor guanylyltransferase [Chloroflexi bacterium]|nr:molybdenum cofactor guanylyltransferase [Chloroflexota bacterium]
MKRRQPRCPPTPALRAQPTTHPASRSAASAAPGSLQRQPETPLTRSALIFGGGRATRLGGRNKALLEVGGTQIIDRIVAQLQPLADELVLLTNDVSLQDRSGLRLVFDAEPHAGVLPALARGLAEARGDICTAVACDMPFVSRRLFEFLLELQHATGADVVIPRTEGYLEPMHAVYRRTTVEAAIRAALARGEQRMISYFADVRVREVAEAEWREVEPEGLAFFNVNTPDDLAAAQRLAAA